MTQRKQENVLLPIILALIVACTYGIPAMFFQSTAAIDLEYYIENN
jgi:hypothetical protein